MNNTDTLSDIFKNWNSWYARNRMDSNLSREDILSFDTLRLQNLISGESDWTIFSDYLRSIDEFSNIWRIMAHYRPGGHYHDLIYKKIIQFGGIDIFSENLTALDPAFPGFLLGIAPGILCYLNLTEILQLLPDPTIVKVHRNTLIDVARVIQFFETSRYVECFNRNLSYNTADYGAFYVMSEPGAIFLFDQYENLLCRLDTYNQRIIYYGTQVLKYRSFTGFLRNSIFKSINFFLPSSQEESREIRGSYSPLSNSWAKRKLFKSINWITYSINKYIWGPLPKPLSKGHIVSLRKKSLNLINNVGSSVLTKTPKITYFRISNPYTIKFRNQYFLFRKNISFDSNEFRSIKKKIGEMNVSKHNWKFDNLPSLLKEVYSMMGEVKQWHARHYNDKWHRRPTHNMSYFGPEKRTQLKRFDWEVRANTRINWLFKDMEEDIPNQPEPASILNSQIKDTDSINWAPSHNYKLKRVLKRKTLLKKKWNDKLRKVVPYQSLLYSPNFSVDQYYTSWIPKYLLSLYFNAKIAGNYQINNPSSFISNLFLKDKELENFYDQAKIQKMISILSNTTDVDKKKELIGVFSTWLKSLKEIENKDLPPFYFFNQNKLDKFKRPNDWLKSNFIFNDSNKSLTARYLKNFFRNKNFRKKFPYYRPKLINFFKEAYELDLLDSYIDSNQRNILHDLQINNSHDLIKEYRRGRGYHIEQIEPSGRYHASNFEDNFYDNLLINRSNSNSDNFIFENYLNTLSELTKKESYQNLHPPRVAVEGFKKMTKNKFFQFGLRMKIFKRGMVPVLLKKYMKRFKMDDIPVQYLIYLYAKSINNEDDLFNYNFDSFTSKSFYNNKTWLSKVYPLVDFNNKLKEYYQFIISNTFKEKTGKDLNVKFYDDPLFNDKNTFKIDFWEEFGVPLHDQLVIDNHKDPIAYLTYWWLVNNKVDSKIANNIIKKFLQETRDNNWFRLAFYRKFSTPIENDSHANIQVNLMSRDLNLLKSNFQNFDYFKKNFNYIKQVNNFGVEDPIFNLEAPLAMEPRPYALERIWDWQAMLWSRLRKNPLLLREQAIVEKLLWAYEMKQFKKYVKIMDRHRYIKRGLRSLGSAPAMPYYDRVESGQPHVIDKERYRTNARRNILKTDPRIYKTWEKISKSQHDQWLVNNSPYDQSIEGDMKDNLNFDDWIWSNYYRKQRLFKKIKQQARYISGRSDRTLANYINRYKYLVNLNTKKHITVNSDISAEIKNTLPIPPKKINKVDYFKQKREELLPPVKEEWRNLMTVKGHSAKEEIKWNLKKQITLLNRINAEYVSTHFDKLIFTRPDVDFHSIFNQNLFYCSIYEGMFDDLFELLDLIEIFTFMAPEEQLHMKITSYIGLNRMKDMLHEYIWETHYADSYRSIAGFKINPLTGESIKLANSSPLELTNWIMSRLSNLKFNDKLLKFITLKKLETEFNTPFNKMLSKIVATPSLAKFFNKEKIAKFSSNKKKYFDSRYIIENSSLLGEGEDVVGTVKLDQNILESYDKWFWNADNSYSFAKYMFLNSGKLASGAHRRGGYLDEHSYLKRNPTSVNIATVGRKWIAACKENPSLSIFRSPLLALLKQRGLFKKSYTYDKEYDPYLGKNGIGHYFLYNWDKLIEGWPRYKHKQVGLFYDDYRFSQIYMFATLLDKQWVASSKLTRFNPIWSHEDLLRKMCLKSFDLTGVYEGYCEVTKMFMEYKVSSLLDPIYKKAKEEIFYDNMELIRLMTAYEWSIRYNKDFKDPLHEKKMKNINSILEHYSKELKKVEEKYEESVDELLYKKKTASNTFVKNTILKKQPNGNFYFTEKRSRVPKYYTRYGIPSTYQPKSNSYFQLRNLKDEIVNYYSYFKSRMEGLGIVFKGDYKYFNQIPSSYYSVYPKYKFPFKDFTKFSLITPTRWRLGYKYIVWNKWRGAGHRRISYMIHHAIKNPRHLGRLAGGTIVDYANNWHRDWKKYIPREFFHTAFYNIYKFTLNKTHFRTFGLTEGNLHKDQEHAINRFYLDSLVRFDSYFAGGTSQANYLLAPDRYKRFYGMRRARFYRNNSFFKNWFESYSSSEAWVEWLIARAKNEALSQIKLVDSDYEYNNDLVDILIKPKIIKLWFNYRNFILDTLDNGLISSNNQDLSKFDIRFLIDKTPFMDKLEDNNFSSQNSLYKLFLLNKSNNYFLQFLFNKNSPAFGSWQAIVDQLFTSFKCGESIKSLLDFGMEGNNLTLFEEDSEIKENIFQYHKSIYDQPRDHFPSHYLLFQDLSPLIKKLIIKQK